MALIPKPDVNIRWAEGGNQLEPASEVQELGFVVEKPPYEVVNWLHNKHDTAVAYLYQEGFADWDIETEYSNTSYVKYNGYIYKSLLQNIAKQPDLNQSVWKIAFANYEDLENLNYDLQETKNTVGHGSNLVYKSAPVMTDLAVGTAFSANIGLGTNNGYQFNNHNRDGIFHDGSKPVVLNDGTTVASFSGNINSPADKDVVTFEMLKKFTEKKVGSLYLTTNNVNPSEELGYGSWQRYAEGRALVGYSSDVSSNTPDWLKGGGNLFGSYTHQLTVDELAAHSHVTTFIRELGTRGSNAFFGDESMDGTDDKVSKSTGGNQPHNNVQPSIVVYIWRRVS